MACDRWQQAISAIADGEDPGVEPRLLTAHLASCASCRAFEGFISGGSAAGAPRLQTAPSMPDLSRKVTKLNAIADRAANIIVAHNHPSGTLTPSQADIDVTHRLKETGELIDIKLIDHILVTKGAYQSIKIK